MMSSLLNRGVAFLLVLGMVLCMLLFGATAAQAETAPVPELKARVTDLTGTLTAQQQAHLEEVLKAFEAEKGSQIAVLMVPTTQPEDIAQYGIRVVDKWRLGRKGVDDGVLVLVAKNDRAARIEVGYGLEGVIPDALSKRIIEEVMIPHFRQGDFAGGLNAGVESLIGLIKGEPLPAPKGGTHPNQEIKVDGSLVALILVLFTAISLICAAMPSRWLGGLVNGGLTGTIAWTMGSGIWIALLVAVFGFLFVILRGGGGGGWGGGFPGGGGFSGGSGFSGGGFSGGGGGFGGGGSSGRW